MMGEAVAVETAKQEKEKRIAVILIVVLILLLFWNVNRQKHAKELRTKFEATRPTATTQNAPVSTGASVPSSELEKYISTLSWKRDPFALGVTQGGKAPTLQLKVSGIIYDETRPEATYAIINQEVVRIGDTFHGINVIDIQPNYVRLKKMSEEIILYLYKEEENK